MQPTILHLIPTLEGGGAERQLRLLATEQVRRGLSVLVAVRRGGNHEQQLRSAGVALHLLGDYRGPDPRLLMGVHAVVRQTRPDVIQTWLPQMDIAGGLASLRSAIPWILTERASRQAFSRFDMRTWLRLSLGRHASAIVANSREGASYWRAAGAPSARLSVVRNAVDVQAVQDASRAGAPDRGQPVTRTALIVGRLDHQKAIDVVLHAIARLDAATPLRVLIIGNGPLRAKLVRIAERLGLAGRVEFSPFRSDWWGLLGQSSVLVSMSRFEGHPNVVLEAIAAGCPVIVSDIPEHREFLSEDCAMLTPPEDPGTLARALQRVLDDPESAQLRAQRAIERIATLTVQSAADGYQEIYRRVLEGRV